MTDQVENEAHAAYTKSYQTATWKPDLNSFVEGFKKAVEAYGEKTGPIEQPEEYKETPPLETEAPPEILQPEAEPEEK